MGSSSSVTLPPPQCPSTLGGRQMRQCRLSAAWLVSPHVAPTILDEVQVTEIVEIRVQAAGGDVLVVGKIAAMCGILGSTFPPGVRSSLSTGFSIISEMATMSSQNGERGTWTGRSTPQRARPTMSSLPSRQTAVPVLVRKSRCSPHPPMTRRKSAPWMEQVDEKILEYMRSEGWASPSVLARERSIVASEGRIRDRCDRLVYAELAAPLSASVYDITMDGLLYIRGELDARHKPTRLVLDDDRFPAPPQWTNL